MSKTDREKLKEKIKAEAIKNLSSGKHGESSSAGYYSIIESYPDAEGSKEIAHIDLELLSGAPDEWNFFPKISHSKLFEMMFSIQENGLFNPIIVWEYDFEDEKDKDCKYMILSGHNRVDAYNTIIRTYEKNPDFNRSEYEKIPAFIFGKDEINEEKAKEIIIDTNYIQREKDDRRIMPLIVKNRMDIIKNRKDIEGRTVDAVAKDLGISGTKVFEDHQIATKIVPELNELYFTLKLKKKPLLRYAYFSEDIQFWIIDKFGDLINNENSMKLKKGMTKSEIEKCFTEVDEDKERNISFRVPESLEEEFTLMCEAWLKSKIE